MTGIHVCVTCDYGTGLPDEHWLSVADQGETTDLCPECGRDV